MFVFVSVPMPVSLRNTVLLLLLLLLMMPLLQVLQLVNTLSRKQLASLYVLAFPYMPDAFMRKCSHHGGVCLHKHIRIISHRKHMVG
jgi:hypothetical protein